MKCWTYNPFLNLQIAELKAAQIPSTNSLRNTLVDPAVNLIIIKLKKELEATKTKVTWAFDQLKYLDNQN